MANTLTTSPVFEIWVTFSRPPLADQKHEKEPDLVKSEISEARNLKFLGEPVWVTRSQWALTSCGAISISLTEADLADFNLECLAAATKVLNLDVDNGQSRWFS